jgi:hypothetical protein
MIRSKEFGKRFYEMWADTCINSETSDFEKKWKKEVMGVLND